MSNLLDKAKDKIAPMAGVNGSAKILTRDAILEVQDIEIELVEVPEWGGAVYVKGMTTAERGKVETAVVHKRGKKISTNMAILRETIAAYSVCDEDGNLIFTPADVKQLAKKSAAALDRIFSVARRLSGMDDETIDELTEEMEEDPFGDSPID